MTYANKSLTIFEMSSNKNTTFRMAHSNRKTKSNPIELFAAKETQQHVSKIPDEVTFIPSTFISTYDP